MANTERLRTIQLVRNAKNSVSSARFSSAFTLEDRAPLERAFNLLHQLEDMLILQEVSDNVGAIENASVQLDAVAEEMRNAVKTLEAVAELIHKAAVAAKVLADIASRVAAGGLLPA